MFPLTAMTAEAQNKVVASNDLVLLLVVHLWPQKSVVPRSAVSAVEATPSISPVLELTGSTTH